MHIPPISIRPSGLLSIALKTLFPLRACHNKLVLSTCPRKPSSTPNAPAQQLQCLRSCSNDINTYVARAHFHTTFEPIHDLYSVPPKTNNVPRHLPHHPREKGANNTPAPGAPSRPLLNKVSQNLVICPAISKSLPDVNHSKSPASDLGNE